jgi:hypothetical protein
MDDEKTMSEKAVEAATNVVVASRKAAKSAVRRVKRVAKKVMPANKVKKSKSALKKKTGKRVAKKKRAKKV